MSNSQKERVLELHGPTADPIHAPWAADPPNTSDHPADIIVTPDSSPSEAQDPHVFGGLQSAIDETLKTDSSKRRYIEVKSGYYEGPVYVPKNAPPLTIWSQEAPILAAGIDAQMSGAEYKKKFARGFANTHPETRLIFEQIAARQWLSTQNTSVLRIEADDVTLSGLTIKNLYDCDRKNAAPEGASPDAQGRYCDGQHQAVALHVAGADRVTLHALRLSSFQDTLYLQTPNPFEINRIALWDCEIEGDVDFIFGGATAYFETCELRTRGQRGAQSWVVAPCTNIRARFGFVFKNCRFTHDGSAFGKGTSKLGRQWFEGVRATPYLPTDKAELPTGYSCRFSDTSEYRGHRGSISQQTLEAVGKCYLVGCDIEAHIASDPWQSWTGPAWSPRYRPVQSSAADFLGNLDDFLRTADLGYQDIDPDEKWLLIE